jgi:hypothetical protein
MTVPKKPDRRGEHEATVKTIARGMPGVFRCDRGDYARMLILFCMRGCGRIERPAFPAPSVSEGGRLLAKPGRIAPWDRGVVSAVIARSGLSAVAQRAKAEATKQSTLSCLRIAPWIASRSLSSGAHSRDPLARNDGRLGCLKIESDLPAA